MAVIIASAQFSMRKQLEFDPLNKETDIDVYADYCMSELHEMIWEDDLEDVQKHLTEEAANLKKILRKQDKDRRTPLIYSIIRRNTPITKLLIAKKANVNFANAEEGWTPLMYAIYHGFREGVDLLLEAGADPNAESTNKRPVTPLLLACGLGDTPAVAKLLKRGANMQLMFNSMGDYFFNPLMVAIHSTDIPEKLTRMAMAEMLINEGVDIQRPRSDGITPLMACMDKCMFETAKELIDHAARCDKEVNGYITALYMAMLRGSVQMGELLIQNGAKVFTGKNKSTPLHAAVSAGHPQCVKFLLENGHQPVPLDKAGFTPLHIAAILENPGPLKMLLEKNVNVSVPSRVGKLLPLHCAAIAGRTENCRLLIEHKANIETRDKKDGITPLIGTLFNNHVETARYLIEAGADIMTRRNDDQGITPLVNAVALQRTEMANLICEKAKRDAHKIGTLKKKGGGHRSSAYKKRLFVLYGVYFLYYKTAKQVEPQGIIVLDGAKAQPSAGSKKGEFVVITSRRNYEMQAASIEERDQWIEAIEKNIAQYGVESPNSPSFNMEGSMPKLVGEED